jgi:hypothetical protein
MIEKIFWNIVDFAWLILAAIAALAFMVAIALIIYWPFGAYECRSKSSAMQVERSYGPVQGCMIKVDGKFIPIGSYRTHRIEKNS